jgi:putative mRNA 3-end processing factor
MLRFAESLGIGLQPVRVSSDHSVKARAIDRGGDNGIAWTPMSETPQPESWLHTTGRGLYCAPGDFFVDPHRPVDRAVVTHGHGDHARPGHANVLATAETIDIMKLRYGADAGRTLQAQATGEPIRIGDVNVTLVPAGHILGSAQVVLDWQGQRIVVSGDYKRVRDPTCAPFEPVRCDVFVTEATFGLPVFRHEPGEKEVEKLLASQRAFPERTHLVGVYGLGKAQRVIALLREAGYDAPIWLHGALIGLCDYYESQGIALGDLRPATGADKVDLRGAMVMAPPGALRERWSRRLNDPLPAFASGWMRVRQRARQRGVELPLVISDHADWDELIATIEDVEAPEVWVTHGREDALVHQINKMGRRGRALALIGRDEE